MAVLLENVTNYVWHAFTALQADKSGLVAKSKLKVLTANIATILDLYGVERGLEHYRSTLLLNFEHYKYYLQKEVFSSLPDRLQRSELRNYEAKIAETCWFVCSKNYTSRGNGKLLDDSLFQLFTIFCLLGELTLERDGSSQVLLHPSEVSYVAKILANSLGCTWDEDDFQDLSVSIGAFRFCPFVAVLESRCFVDIQLKEAIHEAVLDLYQTLVEDVIKKGNLFKKGYIFPSMREYWFVLRPSELVYYKSRSEKEQSGSFHLEPGTKVEPKTGDRILLTTSERTFELGAGDHMTRLQWISALQLAVDHSHGLQSYQRLQASKRRMQRQERSHEILRTRVQLQKERSARKAAEGQAKELEAVVKEESQRLVELNEIKEKLEKLLEEETRAKRDEEIVRALQARVLAEEWEKREELEKLQKEQKELLEEERCKRKEFEELQRTKETQLKAAEQRLRQLEDEKGSLDVKLKDAHDKIQQSEKQKEILETKLMHVAPLLGEGHKIRRTHSYIPSAKERPIILEIRAATLRRPKV